MVGSCYDTIIRKILQYANDVVNLFVSFYDERARYDCVQ